MRFRCLQSWIPADNTRSASALEDEGLVKRPPRRQRKNEPTNSAAILATHTLPSTALDPLRGSEKSVQRVSIPRNTAVVFPASWPATPAPQPPGASSRHHETSYACAGRTRRSTRGEGRESQSRRARLRWGRGGGGRSRRGGRGGERVRRRGGTEGSRERRRGVSLRRWGIGGS